MKPKRLSALLLLLCILSALCACRNTPSSDGVGETTKGELQTAHVIGIRPADTLGEGESFEFPTETLETQPPEGVTVDSLAKFFLDDTNRNGKLLPAPTETDESGNKIYGNATDPARVPNTDRSSLYGNVYRFRLTVDRTTDAFCFQYDTVEQKLAVVIPEVNIPLLLIFRLDGVTGEEITRMARDGDYVTATLIHARNLPSYEIKYLYSSFSGLTSEEIESIPSARYLVALSGVGGTSMYGSYAHDAVTWMGRMLSTYGKEPS